MTPDGEARTRSPWRDPQWDTVTFCVPLPFNVRLDMAETGQRIRGILNSRDYTIFTTRLTVGEAGYSVGSTQTKPLEGEFVRKLSWSALQSVDTGELWVAVVGMRLDQLDQAVEMTDNDVAIAAFERALEFTNHYLRAYTIGAEDSAIRMLTPEALDAAALPVEFSNSAKPNQVDVGTFSTPAATRHDSHMVRNEDLLYARVQQGVQSTNNRHPMDDVILWRVRAEHHVDWVGDYELAVMALQTAVERRVFVIRACMIVDEGGQPPTAEMDGATAFKTAFRDLGSRLAGGPWDLTNRSNPVGQYWHDLYELRNRVAHSGTSVDRVAVEQAFNAERELAEEIERRLLQRKTKYKRTALLVLGGVGLKERHMLSGTMRDFINELQRAGKSHDFWLP